MKFRIQSAGGVRTIEAESYDEAIAFVALPKPRGVRFSHVCTHCGFAHAFHSKQDDCPGDRGWLPSRWTPSDVPKPPHGWLLSTRKASARYYHRATGLSFTVPVRKFFTNKAPDTILSEMCATTLTKHFFRKSLDSMNKYRRNGAQ